MTFVSPYPLMCALDFASRSWFSRVFDHFRAFPHQNQRFPTAALEFVHNRSHNIVARVGSDYVHRLNSTRGSIHVIMDHCACDFCVSPHLLFPTPSPLTLPNSTLLARKLSRKSLIHVGNGIGEKPVYAAADWQRVCTWS